MVGNRGSEGDATAQIDRPEPGEGTVVASAELPSTVSDGTQGKHNDLAPAYKNAQTPGAVRPTQSFQVRQRRRRATTVSAFFRSPSAVGRKSAHLRRDHGFFAQCSGNCSRAGQSAINARKYIAFSSRPN